MRIYYDRQECVLEASPQGLTLRTVRLGLTIYTFPQTWTPEHVWESLAFANQAYDFGYSVGQRALANHIESEKRRQHEGKGGGHGDFVQNL